MTVGLLLTCRTQSFSSWVIPSMVNLVGIEVLMCSNTKKYVFSGLCVVFCVGYVWCDGGPGNPGHQALPAVEPPPLGWALSCPGLAPCTPPSCIISAHFLPWFPLSAHLAPIFLTTYPFLLWIFQTSDLDSRNQFLNLDSKECEHKQNVYFLWWCYKGHHCQHN